jgi:hypothetical protein
MPLWRPRYCLLHHGTLRYWKAFPPFYPNREWDERELTCPTSLDVIQLTGATIELEGGREEGRLAPGDRGGRAAAAADGAAADGADGADGAEGAEGADGAEGVLGVRVVGGDAGERLSFVLRTPRARFPSYTLRANSAAEFDAWVRAIRLQIGREWPRVHGAQHEAWRPAELAATVPEEVIDHIT